MNKNESTTLAKLAKMISDFRIEVIVKFNEYDGKFENLENKASNINERLITVQDAVVGLDRKFDYEHTSTIRRIERLEKSQ